jgi:hypothetical protein
MLIAVPAEAKRAVQSVARSLLLSLLACPAPAAPFIPP